MILTKILSERGADVMYNPFLRDTLFQDSRKMRNFLEKLFSPHQPEISQLAEKIRKSVSTEKISPEWLIDKTFKIVTTGEISGKESIHFVITDDVFNDWKSNFNTFKKEVLKKSGGNNPNIEFIFSIWEMLHLLDFGLVRVNNDIFTASVCGLLKENKFYSIHYGLLKFMEWRIVRCKETDLIYLLSSNTKIDNTLGILYSAEIDVDVMLMCLYETLKVCNKNRSLEGDLQIYKILKKKYETKTIYNSNVEVIR